MSTNIKRLKRVVRVNSFYPNVENSALEFKAGMNGLDTTGMASDEFYPLVSRWRTSLTSRRWRLGVNNGVLQVIPSGSVLLDYPNFLTEYPNQKVDVGVVFNADDSVDIMINGAIAISFTNQTRPTAASTFCQVGALSNLNSGIPNILFNNIKFDSISMMM